MAYRPVVREPTFDAETLEVIGGRQLLNPPTRRSSRWSSYLVKLSDGTTTTLLALMAIRKFGLFDDRFRPMWKDANPFNCVMDNVELYEWLLPRKVEHQRQHIPEVAGTPAYHLAYARKNREKINEYQKARYRRMREALRRMEAEEEKRDESALEEILRLAGVGLKVERASPDDETPPSQG